MAVVIGAWLLAGLVSVQQLPKDNDATKQKAAAVAQTIAAHLERANFRNYRKAGDGLWDNQFSRQSLKIG
jgi:hypothetical protein